MVFPVYFTGQEIEKWWSSMLVLKIHHRNPSSKTVSLTITLSLVKSSAVTVSHSFTSVVRFDVTCDGSSTFRFIS